MERDKFLTEAMGECWHKWDNQPKEIGGEWYYICKCGETSGTNIHYSDWRHWFDEVPDGGGTDFSTWQGFGKLWEWAQEQEWWATEFKRDYWGMLESHIEFIPDCVIGPDYFANAIYEFLKERT